MICRRKATLLITALLILSVLLIMSALILFLRDAPYSSWNRELLGEMRKNSIVQARGLHNRPNYRKRKRRCLTDLLKRRDAC